MSVLAMEGPGLAGDEPRIPGAYVKLTNGAYKWLPPIAHDDDGLYDSRVDDLAPESRRARPKPRLSPISIGDILLAPTIDLSEIDYILISTGKEKLRFLLSVAFADEYASSLDATAPGASLIVTRWGFSSDHFDAEQAKNGAFVYRAKNPRSYFTSFTYPRAGAAQGKIIDVGRVLATDNGFYLFNTSGSLSNLLWNIRLNRRQAGIPETADLLRKLERNASRYNEWGTVAWTYKDFGDRAKAVEIYRDKVIPHTEDLNESERRVWQQYFEEIKK